MTESEKDCEVFKSSLDSNIDVKFAEIMQRKTAGNEFLTYVDGQILTAGVRNVFKNSLKITPPQIEAACNLSDAVLAPTAAEKKRLIKTALGGGGAMAGIGMIIGGVGAALGWGAGMVAGVTAFFVGGHVLGPVMWVTSGVAIAAIAGYFMTTSDNFKDTERFLKVLKNATANAVDAIWSEHGETLSKLVKREPTA